jgi:hypothetical protein
MNLGGLESGVDRLDDKTTRDRPALDPELRAGSAIDGKIVVLTLEDEEQLDRRATPHGDRFGVGGLPHGTSDEERSLPFGVSTFGLGRVLSGERRNR